MPVVDDSASGEPGNLSKELDSPLRSAMIRLLQSSVPKPLPVLSLTLGETRTCC